MPIIYEATNEHNNYKNSTTSSTDSGIIMNESSSSLNLDSEISEITKSSSTPHLDEKKKTSSENFFNGRLPERTSNSIEEITEDDSSVNFTNSTSNEKHHKRKHLHSFSSNSSNHVSINSLNDNDSDTSISVEDTSDSESENDESKGYIVKKLGQQSGDNVNKNEILLDQNGGNGVVKQCEDLSTNININSLNLTQNSGVTIGNTFVIKQYLLEKRKNEAGNDNSAFENNEDDVNKETENSNEKNKIDLESSKTKLLLKSKATIWTGSIFVVILVIGISVLTYLEFTKKPLYANPGDGDDSRENKPINSTIGDDIIDPGKVLRMISRDEWIAQPPNNELADLNLPVSRVIIAHTATEDCLTQAKCTFRVRFIQTFHMESRNFDDIGYNFLVGGDGAVYIGRNWEKQGAHTKGYNVDSICIAFIGTFNKLKPTDGQLNAAKLLIAEGVRLGKLKPDYKLYGHRNFIASESPGDTLYNIIKSWPHFAST